MLCPVTFASLKESSGLRRAASLACLHLLGFVISWLCDAEHGGFESSFTGAQRPERTARFCLQCRAEAAGGSQRCLSSGLSGSSRRSGEMRESEQSRKDRQQKRKKKGKKMEKEKKKKRKCCKVLGNVHKALAVSCTAETCCTQLVQVTAFQGKAPGDSLEAASKRSGTKRSFSLTK